MFDQRMPSSQNGRRSTDWFGRAGKVIGLLLSVSVLLAAAGKGYLVVHQVEVNTTELSTHNERIKVLEQIKVDDHFMTCSMYEKDHPRTVPASCDLAIRRHD